ncbi:hypothetical protein HNY73_011368 [Argiope bruennichi]|uniref:Uncharacterized protein n=1 Tax=Argiope bruennichi TaxID=94029 RepID=A0A8T0F903_ARGBR|nr:hypothetical protein HNY73_011368 [Argiope bruennichi]
MEVPINNWEFKKPGVPSLLHICSVKIAIPLFKSFDIEIWQTILKEMKHAAVPVRPEILEVNNAKEKLLLIPAHLRLGILETIMSMDLEVAEYCLINPFVELKDVFKTIDFKTDGTIKIIQPVNDFYMCEDDINCEPMCDLGSYIGDLCVYSMLGEKKYSEFMASYGDGNWNGNLPFDESDIL